MAVEFWTMGGGRPTSDDPAVFDGVKQAVSAEQLGYDGIVYVDSQNLVADCYVSMALAAHATTRIQLGTGVTNSYTRHAAITASAIGAIQAESRGRAHLGIGRGDSALAHLGLAPHALAPFERYLKELQEHTSAARKSRSSRATWDALGLADTPVASRVAYIRGDGTEGPSRCRGDRSASDRGSRPPRRPDQLQRRRRCGAHPVGAWTWRGRLASKQG